MEWTKATDMIIGGSKCSPWERREAKACGRGQLGWRDTPVPFDWLKLRVSSKDSFLRNIFNWLQDDSFLDSFTTCITSEGVLIAQL